MYCTSNHSTVPGTMATIVFKKRIGEWVLNAIVKLHFHLTTTTTGKTVRYEKGQNSFKKVIFFIHPVCIPFHYDYVPDSCPLLALLPFPSHFQEHLQLNEKEFLLICKAYKKMRAGLGKAWWSGTFPLDPIQTEICISLKRHC